MSDESLEARLDADLSAARARRAGSAIATKQTSSDRRPRRMSSAEVEAKRRKMQEAFLSMGPSVPDQAQAVQPPASAEDGSDAGAGSIDDVSDDVQAALEHAFDTSGQGASEGSSAGSETPSEASVSSSGVSGHEEVIRPSLSAYERAQRGMDAWTEAFSRFYTDVVADDADISSQTEEVRHEPAARRSAKSRGGRIAAEGAPVQIRGISRALFEVARSEFPQLTNAKALEAYIARTSGRFDLVEDEEVRAAALEAAATDGTVAALANEMAAMRRSMRALRIEASVASLAAIMSDVDVRSDDVSDQLFVRMRELIAISSAYDDAIRAAQGRLPHGYGD